MKNSDRKLQEYKHIREKNLPVYIQKRDHIWDIYTTKKFFIHAVDSREQAVQFCRELGFNIIGFVTLK